MRILFCGDRRGNAGPSNVNKGIVSNLTESFDYIKNQNKCLKLMELFFKGIWSSVIVVSGTSKLNCVAVAMGKLLRKKTVYIMHGYVAYEVVVNKQENVDAALAQERYILENADLLLPVSKKFMHWMHEKCPQYAHKTKYIYNGAVLPAKKKDNYVKEKGKIIATGGDREIKNNRILSEIIEDLGGRLHLDVCGTIYHKKPECYQYSCYLGIVSHSEFVERLKKAELFVLNSIMESFSLSTIEALFCGCSVLVSNLAGVTDLLDLEETDIIFNPVDKEEIRTKMLYLLEHPNNDRIMSKFIPEKWTYQKMVERLECLCRELAEA